MADQIGSYKTTEGEVKSFNKTRTLLNRKSYPIQLNSFYNNEMTQNEDDDDEGSPDISGKPKQVINNFLSLNYQDNYEGKL